MKTKTSNYKPCLYTGDPCLPPQTKYPRYGPAPMLHWINILFAVAVLPDATNPTILLAQCLKVILGFQTLWPAVLSHINFDLKKLLPGQQEMNFPPISQQLTLQILLQAPAGSLKWYQQVSFSHSVEYTVPPKASKVNTCGVVIIGL